MPRQIEAVTDRVERRRDRLSRPQAPLLKESAHMTLILSEAGQNVVAGTFGRAMKRAGEALGSMSGQVIDVQTPMLQRCSANDVLDMAGGPESIVLAVYVGIFGSIEGHALLLFSPADAHRLARILLAGLLGPGELPIDPTADVLEYDELELSALQEAGNVTISAFLNELGMHLHEPVQPTPPQVVIEMAGAVLDAVLLDLVTEADQMLAAQTTFSEGGRAIDGTLLVLPRADSLRVLLDALGALGI
jgi:chemotaxis protein CheC